MVFSMKKHLLIASQVFCGLLAYAQGPLEALRYSYLNSGGTARTMGMAGSFSSIGADASMIGVNPAGLGVFRRGEFDFGFQFLNTAVNSSYIDASYKASILNFNIPNINLVFSKIMYDSKGKPLKRGLVNANYSFGINRTGSMSNRFVFDADNKKSSIMDYLADVANAHSNGGNLDVGTQEYIAFQGGAIWDTGGLFRPFYRGANADIRNNNQSGEVTGKGRMYEYQAAGALNFSHRVQVGLGLYIASLYYNEIFNITETDNRPNKGMYTPDIKTLDYQYKFTDQGSAYGARFGVIARPTDQLRLGFSIHTPRMYKIKSTYGYSVACTADPGAPSAPPTAYNDPLSTYNYRVTTPARINAGVGFILQKRMIISADFDFYNYANALLASPDDPKGFNTENAEIRKNYQNVITTRLGMELNMPNANNPDQNYRLRLGYANLPTPYSPRAAGLDEVLRKASNVFSTGFGIRDKDYYFDMALTLTTNSFYYVPYTVSDPSYPYYNITNKQKRVAFTATLGFNFD